MNRTPSTSCQLAAVAGCLAVAVAVSQAAQAGTGVPPADTTRPTKAAHWVLAPSKHNGSGIRLRYEVPAQLQPGQAATVLLQFSGVTSEGASAELRAPEGATLTAADGSAVGRLALPRGQVTAVSLRLVPAGDGLQTLDVFTAQDERASAQSVPLNVGSGAVKLKSMGKPQTSPGGEKVISLPAQPDK